jgi:hypothetical protein
VGAIAAFDKEAVNDFRREYPLDKVIPGLGESNGMPPRWRSTDEEKQAFDDQRQQAAMLEQVMAAAPALAQAGKTAAEAEAIGGGV